MTSAAETFVHLRVRSAYSLLEGAIKAGDIPALALKEGAPAAALTDRTNLFGALEFSQAMKDAGVQPIIGCTLPISGIGEGRPERWARAPTVVLLAQNEAGWLNLMDLSSVAYLQSDTDEPQVPWDMVVERSEGLILLSGGPDGPVNPLYAAGKAEAADAVLQTMASVFGDRFYVELQRHGLPEEAAAEPGLVGLRLRQRRCRLVATNDVYFADAAMHKAHEALLCISDGAFLSQDDRRRVSPDHGISGLGGKAMRDAH